MQDNKTERKERQKPKTERKPNNLQKPEGNKKRLREKVVKVSPLPERLETYLKNGNFDEGSKVWEIHKNSNISRSSNRKKTFFINLLSMLLFFFRMGKKNVPSRLNGDE